MVSTGGFCLVSTGGFCQWFLSLVSPQDAGNGGGRVLLEPRGAGGGGALLQSSFGLLPPPSSFVCGPASPARIMPPVGEY